MNENEIIEEWRPVVGYEGLYEVSNLGRIKSLGNDKTRKEKILSQYENKNGYLYVNLCKDGKVKNCRVNRLVGNAFIENPNNYPCYNHKNEIKTDNRAENLEPCTHKYNTNFGTCIQRRVEKERNGVRSKQVYQYTKDYELVAIWQSTRECGRNGYNQGAVAARCRSKVKSYKGYIWSYYPL